MAITTYTNPRYYKGPMLQLQESVKAVDGLTWQAGQFCRNTDSGVVPCKTQAVSIQGLFAKTQVTATSSSYVPVYWIPSTQTKFVIGVTSSASDAKANPSMIGGNFGLGVNSCICTISRSCDTGTYEALHVEDVYANAEPNKTDTSDTAGKVIVSVVASFLQAEGAGV